MHELDPITATLNKYFGESGDPGYARGACPALQPAGSHHRDVCHGTPGARPAAGIFPAGAVFLECGESRSHPADRGDDPRFRLRPGRVDHRPRISALCHVRHLRAALRAALEPSGHGAGTDRTHIRRHGSVRRSALVLVLLPLPRRPRAGAGVTSNSFWARSGGSPP